MCRRRILNILFAAIRTAKFYEIHLLKLLKSLKLSKRDTIVMKRFCNQLMNFALFLLCLLSKVAANSEVGSATVINCCENKNQG